MLRKGVGVLLLLVAGCTDPAPAPSPTAATAGDCRVTRVIDGDTVDLSCNGRAAERARLTGFDTPEVFSSRCPEERDLGNAATARLRALLREGTVLTVSRSGYDDYGRVLARLSIDGRDVASTMISEGLAVRYTGGRRIDWCQRLA